jgi:hypothetical protein
LSSLNIRRCSRRSGRQPAARALPALSVAVCMHTEVLGSMSTPLCFRLPTRTAHVSPSLTRARLAGLDFLPAKLCRRRAARCVGPDDFNHIHSPLTSCRRAVDALALARALCQRHRRCGAPAADTHTHTHTHTHTQEHIHPPTPVTDCHQGRLMQLLLRRAESKAVVLTVMQSGTHASIVCARFVNKATFASRAPLCVCHHSRAAQP